MRHLTPADYIRQPWKNGKGITVELARADAGGNLLWRLSMATVAEDGPFSLFPGIERNLTVISGPGFRLVGAGLSLDCLPLGPVAFPGDVAVAAEGTGGQVSDDFNVMTARHLPRPDVLVLNGAGPIAAGGLLAVFALSPLRLSGRRLGRHDLVLASGPLELETPGPALLVRLHGLPQGGKP